MQKSKKSSIDQDPQSAAAQSSQQMLQQMQQQSQKQQIEMTQKQQQAQQAQQAAPNNQGKASRTGNQKNTYIKKISTLIEKHVSPNDPNSQLPPEIEQGGAKVKRNKSTINVQENEDKSKLKLARNRESARNSRKRKKIYLELLENKVTQLNEFLNESKEINKNSEDLLGDLQKQIQQKNEMSNQKQILFRNLQIALQLQSTASDADINGIIDSLKSRYGTVNKERLEVLDYCYKQIAEQILPIHMQYVLYSCKFKKDIFSDAQNTSQQQQDNNSSQDNQDEDFPNIIKSLDFSEKQTKKCQKLQKVLTKEKQNLDRQLQQLFDAKEQMKEELQSLDNTFEDLRKDFAPNLIGKFLMEVEKYQYNSNMKKSFDKFFSAKANNLELNIDKSEDDEDDCDSEGDLYEFIKSEDSCNNLMVDINHAYDIYVDAYDFLSKKQKMQNDDNNQKQEQQASNN